MPDGDPTEPAKPDLTAYAIASYIEAILRLFVELETAVDAWQAIYDGRAAQPHGPSMTASTLAPASAPTGSALTAATTVRTCRR